MLNHCGWKLNIRTNLLILFTAPGDYSGAAVTMTFPAGVTLVDFPIPIVNDILIEGMERFDLSLSSSDDVVLGPDSAVEILDDEGEFIAFRVAYYQSHYMVLMTIIYRNVWK